MAGSLKGRILPGTVRADQIQSPDNAPFSCGMLYRHSSSASLCVENSEIAEIGDIRVFTRVAITQKGLQPVQAFWMSSFLWPTLE